MKNKEELEEVVRNMGTDIIEIINEHEPEGLSEIFVTFQTIISFMLNEHVKDKDLEFARKVMENCKSSVLTHLSMQGWE